MVCCFILFGIVLVGGGGGFKGVGVVCFDFVLS